MRRRSLLALVGSLAVGSGCTGSGDDISPNGTVTAMPVPSPTERTSERRTGDRRAERNSLTVSDVAVQPGVVTARTDSIGVVDDAGQYLFLNLEGDVPDRSAVEFRFSGASYLPEELRRPLYRDEVDGETYGENGGPLVFALPETGDGTDAELAWGEGSWAPPETVIERLEDPLPPFSVSMEGPETDAGSELEITVSVTNEGAGVGRYVLALNRQGPRIASAPAARFAGELDAGANATHTVEAVPPESDRRTVYLLDVPGREDNLSHTIVSAGSDR